MSYHKNNSDSNHNDSNKLSKIRETVQKCIESIARKKGGSQSYQREVCELQRKLLLSRKSLEQYGMGHYFRDNSIHRMHKMRRKAVLELLRQIENDLNQRISEQEDGGDNNCDGCPLKQICEAQNAKDVFGVIFGIGMLLVDDDAVEEVLNSPHLQIMLFVAEAYLARYGIFIRMH